jgi:hypothetical protein
MRGGKEKVHPSELRVKTPRFISQEAQLPATGNPVLVKGTVIDCLTGGKIDETGILMDMLGLMRQLGAVSSPGGQALGRTRPHKSLRLGFRVFCLDAAISQVPAQTL